MTTEEKAKAYDEALILTKRIISKNCTEVEKLLLKCIFPQLAESEDEKMRKAALEGIEYLEREMGWDAINDIDILDVKEYLKKQKEQKPIKWTDLTWKDINDLERIINNVHYEFSAGIGEKSFGEEVLERFRSTKGDEYPE